jgi:hypothetical protein
VKFAMAGIHNSGLTRNSVVCGFHITFLAALLQNGLAVFQAF